MPGFQKNSASNRPNRPVVSAVLVMATGSEAVSRPEGRCRLFWLVCVYLQNDFGICFLPNGNNRDMRGGFHPGASRDKVSSVSRELSSIFRSRI